MIFIVVKWPIKPEYADDWLTHCAEFTAATRAEEGNLFFDWSRSAEDADEWVLVEGFRDGDAGSAHVNSDHFQTASRELGAYLSATPKVISQEIDATDWVDLAEIQPHS
jgi:quinol monooxygenase YgiN